MKDYLILCVILAVILAALAIRSWILAGALGIIAVSFAVSRRSRA
jgi:hypothetical protein